MHNFIGRVVDQKNQPIKDAKVSLEGLGTPVVKYTDTEGIFLFSISIISSSHVNVNIRVEAEGYKLYNRYIDLSVVNTNPTNPVEIRLNQNDTEKSGDTNPAIKAAIIAASATIIAALIAGVVKLLEPKPTPPNLDNDRTFKLPQTIQKKSPLRISPSPSVEKVAQDLQAVNISFSARELRNQLNNSYSQYPQFANGCLKLLENRRLKQELFFDMIFWNYTQELGGKPNPNSPDGNLDAGILKAAMVTAYNGRYSNKASSFEDIVEPKQ